MTLRQWDRFPRVRPAGGAFPRIFGRSHGNFVAGGGVTTAFIAPSSEAFMSRVFLLLLAALPVTATAADEGRFSYLEQEVRNLQRQVQRLSRQVDELSRPARAGATVKAPQPGAPAGGSDEWIDAAKWARVKPGMSELEAMTLLGPPTSMREENGARVLFYALEIGASGFLGGSVTLRDRLVTEVRTPQLQ
jgi:hypothetical protein